MSHFKILRIDTHSAGYWARLIVAVLTAAVGLITISSTLDALVHLRRSDIVDADAHTTLLAGLSLIYLASLLRRGKRSAWLVCLPIFGFLVIRNVRHFVIDHHFYGIIYFLNIFLPLVVFGCLLFWHKYFTVRSELRNLAPAGRRAILILLVAFIYGTLGFQLMDEKDFHTEISIPAGAHYTVDQFGLTTNKQLVAYSKRAHLFVDSLAAISLGSVFYVILALFAPIRFRLASHESDLHEVRRLLREQPSNSEDFFKLWPTDKAYFFGSLRRSVIAYKGTGGVALAAGDPAGDSKLYDDLLGTFGEFCRLNDWQPAFIHTLEDHLNLYQKHGYEAQKIGEEAVVDIKKFRQQTAGNKYFRHIRNKFTKQGYQTEILQPPHHDDVLKRLKEVSDDWLQVPGRSERGFMMGYFSEKYIQQCVVMVVRDAAGTIQAFINQVPVIDKHEINYDLLRHSRKSLGNINDFLMLDFIDYAAGGGFTRLNMGLCPFSGLDESKLEDPGLVDSLLNLIYANSSRFYSFKGLRKFKEKYEPHWRPRYIVYQGGLVGLSKTSNALMRAMRVKT